MAATIDPTPKGASANSYDTLANAESYMEARSGTTLWDAASDDAKNRALIEATNRLEQEDWHGTPTTGAQRLKHPRSGMTDADSRSWDQDVVARPVTFMQFELAKAIVDGDLELKDTGLEGFDSAMVGPMDVEVNHSYIAGTLPAHVKRFGRGLMIGASELNVPVARN